MTHQNRALLNCLASDGKLILSHTVSHSHISLPLPLPSPLPLPFPSQCSFVSAHKPSVKMPKRPLDQSQISVTLKSQVLLHFLFCFDLIFRLLRFLRHGFCSAFVVTILFWCFIVWHCRAIFSSLVFLLWIPMA